MSTSAPPVPEISLWLEPGHIQLRAHGSNILGSKFNLRTCTCAREREREREGEEPRGRKRDRARFQAIAAAPGSSMRVAADAYPGRRICGTQKPGSQSQGRRSELARCKCECECVLFTAVEMTQLVPDGTRPGSGGSNL